MFTRHPAAGPPSRRRHRRPPEIARRLLQRARRLPQVLNTVLSGGGLQTAAEYKASQARPAAAAPVAEAPKPKTDARAAKRAKITQRAMLSFGDEFEEEEGAAPPPKKGLKCPDAVTDFLPDARRDAEAEAKRQELTAEYRALQAKAKLEPLRVVYSYPRPRRNLSAVAASADYPRRDLY